MTTLAISGLGIVTLSWLIQLLHVSRKEHKLDGTFVLTYGIGTALLLVDQASRGVTFSTVAWLYLINLLVLALMYIQMHK